MPANPHRDRDSSTSVNISSDTLFHFTNKYQNLLNILSNCFSPRYCAEYEPSYYFHIDKASGLPDKARSMICFCDLPIFLIKSHLNWYGEYGIGMRKRWGREKGVTPVQYVHERSTIRSMLSQLSLFVGDDYKPGTTFPSGNAILEHMEAFLKPYDGPAINKQGEEIPYKRFYDEREWRFVPPPVDMRPAKTSLSYDEYSDPDTLTKANDLVPERAKLYFHAPDISYIIVKSDTEVVQLIKELGKMSKYSDGVITYLSSRVLSSEQIRSDF